LIVLRRGLCHESLSIFLRFTRKLLSVRDPVSAYATSLLSVSASRPATFKSSSQLQNTTKPKLFALVLVFCAEKRSLSLG
jgi:hypothetical protein